MQSVVETLWLLGATLLVLAMQAGFLMLEAGRVRTRNAINVAQKNISDIAISWTVYMFIGFVIMFGIFPPGLFSHADNLNVVQFLYQVSFCGAASTIIAGAVAERMAFRAYLFLTICVAAVVYPVVGWIVWGDLFDHDRAALLADAGFIDFAGGTVVHGVAAWTALVACLMLGPRIDRFDQDGKPNVMPGHNSVLSTFGVLILVIGWFGFNMGQLSPLDSRFGDALLNTASAAAVGAVAGLTLGCYLDRGVFNPGRTANGIIGGLVAVTASVALTPPIMSILLAATGGFVAVLASEVLLHRFKIDDPLDVVATHGIPGAMGTLAVAFVVRPEYLTAPSRLSQLGIQALGVSLVVVVTASIVWGVLSLFRKFSVIRVSENDEVVGLNYTEHGVSLSTEHLRRALDSRIAGQPGLFSDIKVEAGDDSSEVAHSLNSLLKRFRDVNETMNSQVVRFENFATTTSDYLWETDAQLNLIYLSGHSGDVGRERLNPALGRNLFEILNFKAQDLADCEKRVASREKIDSVDATVILGVDREDRRVEVSGVPYFNKDQRFLGYRGVANDITERRQAEKKAHFLARHDDLTGLENRRALTGSLADVLQEAEASDQGVAVVGVDLDGFKLVNDAYGHEVGDLLLIKLAQRLRDALREGDSIFRVGGDEFVVVMKFPGVETMRADSKVWCERLIAEVSKPFKLQSLSLRVGASIGVSFFPDSSSSGVELVRMADLAMYEAKTNGKGRLVEFETRMDRDATLKRQIEKDLYEAFESEQFFICYQPKIKVSTGTIVGFEALVRWQHPERGLVAPMDFIPLVEQLNLMPRLGRLVLQEACSFARTWNADDGLHIAVNVSPTQLEGWDFPKIVEDALQSTGLLPEMLEIEITEDMLIRDVGHVQAILGRISELGVSIAIDDFGSGNASLQYLKNFPISKLKIDRCFVKDIGQDTKADHIVRSMISLGRELGLSVTAEGVELDDQLDALSTWHCDEAQGFLFSEPVVTEEVNEMLESEFSQTAAHAS